MQVFRVFFLKNYRIFCSIITISIDYKYFTNYILLIQADLTWSYIRYFSKIKGPQSIYLGPLVVGTEGSLWLIIL